MTKSPLTDLAQFTGTEHWYRHPLARDILYTDGVKYVAETTNAYWLLHEIAFAQYGNPPLLREPFQLWKLIVAPDQSGRLTCEDGNGRTLLSTRIRWTDFPAEGITLYCTDHVILLPSEY